LRWSACSNLTSRPRPADQCGTRPHVKLSPSPLIAVMDKGLKHNKTESSGQCRPGCRAVAEPTAAYRPAQRGTSNGRISRKSSVRRRRRSAVSTGSPCRICGTLPMAVQGARRPQGRARSEPVLRILFRADGLSDQRGVPPRLRLRLVAGVRLPAGRAVPRARPVRVVAPARTRRCDAAAQATVPPSRTIVNSARNRSSTLCAS
jgi:hypothetical protein